jgi:hypothetical protein
MQFDHSAKRTSEVPHLLGMVAIFIVVVLALLKG